MKMVLINSFWRGDIVYTEMLGFLSSTQPTDRRSVDSLSDIDLLVFLELISESCPCID